MRLGETHVTVQASFHGDSWFALGDTTPKTATFTWTGVSGKLFWPHHGDVAMAGAAERVLGRRWPLADLAAPAAARPRRALRLLLDADRYAEGNNPTHARELLASAATIAAHAVTAHRTNQPHLWPPR